MTSAAENNQNNFESNTNNGAPGSEPPDDQMTSEKEKAEKYLANWQRAEADFVNYKKRAEQEKSDLINYSNSNLLLNIVPVLDDFDRALMAVPSKLESSNWIDGVKLINSKLQAVLKAAGITEIEALNKTFDPNLHEAVAHSEGEEGKVISIVQKGYKLKDRVLRPAMVIVGKGKTEIIEEEKPGE